MKWAGDDIDGYLNFYATSGDGRVSNWTLIKTTLRCSDILNIEFTKKLNNFTEETKNLLRGESFVRTLNATLLLIRDACI